ncbi:hypothetical protein JJB09_00150 [Rhizobium sp. KVB221]|uniref:Uncharacterized protein n=1 Tax=Rhizobium setariae TaxID=2801340 RepID=A0A936YKI3_9HYPH|nr:hypothetical protein [Rhizobium setariae]MBL0370427.1 hypothetical protein [Rhizobium setariae]
MPGLDELFRYFRGLWLLGMGKPEGFAWLDLTERGFWRSWWAVGFCLPPMLLSWAGFRLYYLAMMPEGTSLGAFFFAKLLAVEIGNWVVPYIALAVVMSLAGLRAVIPVVMIALNWLSVLLQWAMVPVSLVQVFSPLNIDAQLSIGLPLLMMSGAAYFLIMRQFMGGKSLPAAASLLTMMVSSFWASSTLQSTLGLTVGL